MENTIHEAANGTLYKTESFIEAVDLLEKYSIGERIYTNGGAEVILTGKILDKNTIGEKLFYIPIFNVEVTSDFDFSYQVSAKLQ